MYNFLNKQEGKDMFPIKSEIQPLKQTATTRLYVTSAQEKTAGDLSGHTKTEVLRNHIVELNRELRQKEEELTLHLSRSESDYYADWSRLKNQLSKIEDYFPSVAQLLPWVDYCRSIGLSREQTQQLVQLKRIIYTGMLYSQEDAFNYVVKGARLKLCPDNRVKGVYYLTINGILLSAWFKEKKEEALLQEKSGMRGEP